MLIKCRKFPPRGAIINIYYRRKLKCQAQVLSRTEANGTLHLLINKVVDQSDIRWPVGTRRWFSWSWHYDSYKLFWMREWRPKRARRQV